MKLGTQSTVNPHRPSAVALLFDTRCSGEASSPARSAKRWTRQRSVADWINDIRQAWACGATNTLSLARLISQSKEDMRQSRQWNRLWHSGLTQVTFSKRKAEILATVGLALGNVFAQTFAQMPSGWSILYHLARLGRRKVEQMIGEGAIHPGLSLQEAKTLLAKAQPGAYQKAKRSVVKLRFARFIMFVLKTAAGWSEEERHLVRNGLVQVMKQL
jgi:hypothetical protein